MNNPHSQMEQTLRHRETSRRTRRRKSVLDIHRAKVMEFHEIGLSTRDIAAWLAMHESTTVAHTTVSRAIIRWKIKGF